MQAFSAQTALKSTVLRVYRSIFIISQLLLNEVDGYHKNTKPIRVAQMTVLNNNRYEMCSVLHVYQTRQPIYTMHNTAITMQRVILHYKFTSQTILVIFFYYFCIFCKQKDISISFNNLFKNQHGRYVLISNKYFIDFQCILNNYYNNKK